MKIRFQNFYLSTASYTIISTDGFSNTDLRFLPVSRLCLHTAESNSPRIGTVLSRSYRNFLSGDLCMVPLGSNAVNLSGLLAARRSSFSPISLTADPSFVDKHSMLRRIWTTVLTGLLAGGSAGSKRSALPLSNLIFFPTHRGKFGTSRLWNESN